jgi:hemolysin III
MAGSAAIAHRPSLRGWMHEKAFLVAVPAVIALVLVADGVEAKLASVVYGAGLIALYGVSSSYHRRGWGPEARLRMQRLDHGTIFIMIAGTYTPMCLIVIGGTFGTVLLLAVWVGAVGGFVLAVTGVTQGKRVTLGLYIVMGWAAVAALPQIVRGLDGGQIALLVAGGLLYTVGFVTLTTHWPHPNARRFGYHEVWHTFVVAASICHYLLIWQVVQMP